MSDLAVNVTNLATRMSSECKSLRTLINGNAGDLSTLTTAAKANLVAAINELQAALSAAGGSVAINDAATESGTVWSSSKVAAELANARQALLGSNVSAALDTLKEIEAALGGDANFATTITTALGNRVRVDAAQSLTTTQQAQARTNIGAVAAADVGNTDTDFVAVFVAGLT